MQINQKNYSNNYALSSNFQGKGKSKNENEKHNPSFIRKVGGYFGGSFASSGVSAALSIPLTAAVLGTIHYYPEKDSDNIVNAANDIVKQKGLDKKGVKLLFVDDKNESTLRKIVYKEYLQQAPKSKIGKLRLKITENYFKSINKMMKQSLEKTSPYDAKTNKLLKNFNLKSMQKFMTTVITTMVKKGFNAFYLPEGNVAATAKNRASLIFHEMGHAANANSSKVMKTLITKIRAIPKMVAAPVMLVALCHTNKKSKPEGEKNKFTKALDFIKNNSGKIVFASFLPMIAEEALASIRGVGYAKKALGATKALKIAGLYSIALTSYIGSGAIVGYSTKVAGKVRDKIVYPSEVKKQIKK